MEIALCAIAKNENKYIKEWVEYYKNIGVDKIFLYDNNDIDGECFEDIIFDYINDGYVEVINVRGIEKHFRNSKVRLLQERCYEECYLKNKSTYDWFLFFDIDEFLFLKTEKNIKEFLLLDKFKGVSTILVNWLNYGDSDNVYYEDKPVLERFTKPCRNVNWIRGNKACKSITRGGKNSKIEQTHTHKFFITNGKISNADGKIISRGVIKSLGPKIDKVTYNSAYLKHFVTKTISEYIERYLNRGKVKPVSNQSKVLKYNLNEVINNFFMINKKTNEKIDVIKHYHEYINDMNTKKDIIVSFTTYKPRLPYVHIMIKTLLENTMKPYKIVMTLYNEDTKYITKELQKYIDDGIVELIVCDKDLRSHKKYFYAMQKYREYPIITVDDDVLYSKDLIKSLYESYLKEPNCIHGRRARKISYDKNGFCKKYNNWPLFKEHTNKTDDILFTGIGGILYPPNILNIKDSNIETIDKYISVDDIYLFYLARIKNIKNIWVKNDENTPKTISGTQNCSLYLTDNSEKNGINLNDVAIDELLNNIWINKKKSSIEQENNIQLLQEQNQIKNENPKIHSLKMDIIIKKLEDDIKNGILYNSYEEIKNDDTEIIKNFEENNTVILTQELNENNEIKIPKTTDGIEPLHKVEEKKDDKKIEITKQKPITSPKPNVNEIKSVELVKDNNKNDNKTKNVESKIVVTEQPIIVNNEEEKQINNKNNINKVKENLQRVRNLLDTTMFISQSTEKKINRPLKIGPTRTVKIK